MAAKIAANKTNETKFEALRYKLRQWSMFHFRMSQKLIFIKIQDGRQDGGHMNPMGHDLILGPSKFLN